MPATPTANIALLSQWVIVICIISETRLGIAFLFRVVPSPQASCLAGVDALIWMSTKEFFKIRAQGWSQEETMSP